MNHGSVGDDMSSEHNSDSDRVCGRSAGKSFGRRKVLAGAGLGLAALLTGCTSRFGSSDGTPGDGDTSPSGGTSPGDVTVPGESGTPPGTVIESDEYSYPEGASENGLTNRILASHSKHLAEAGNFTVERTTVAAFGNGAVQEDTTVKAGEAGVLESTVESDLETVMWSTGDRSQKLVRMDGGSGTVYRIDSEPVTWKKAREEEFGSLLSAAVWGSDPTRFVELGGVPTANYRSTEVNSRGAVRQLILGRNLTSFEADAYVAESGYFRRYRVYGEMQNPERTIQRLAKADVIDIGETDVSEPDWVSKAVENGFNFTAEFVDGNTVVRLTVDNGGSVDNFNIRASSPQHSGEANVSEQLSEGDTLNVSFDSNGNVVYGLNEMPDTTTEFTDDVNVKVRHGSNNEYVLTDSFLSLS